MCFGASLSYWRSCGRCFVSTANFCVTYGDDILPRRRLGNCSCVALPSDIPVGRPYADDFCFGKSHQNHFAPRLTCGDALMRRAHGCAGAAFGPPLNFVVGNRGFRLPCMVLLVLLKQTEKCRGGGPSVAICQLKLDRLTETSPAPPPTSMRNLAAGYLCALTTD